MSDSVILYKDDKNQPNIFQKDDELWTTSLDVAEKFDKNHRDVLRAIENLECSEDFNQRNFALVNYVDTKGEKRPMYLISSKGFQFLAMGFTGKKASAWKEKYIDLFHFMARDLSTRAILEASKTPLLLPSGQSHEEWMFQPGLKEWFDLGVEDVVAYKSGKFAKRSEGGWEIYHFWMNFKDGSALCFTSKELLSVHRTIKKIWCRRGIILPTLKPEIHGRLVRLYLKKGEQKTLEQKG